ncbi:DNA-binding protein [Gammaproteobacteria bacterium]|nr:DNA-binding protein [Gammaproteobacteria bacterium]
MPKIKATHDANIDQLVEISALYYIDGITQEELSQRFNLSRPKVGRLLKRAREEGIVEIRVHNHPDSSTVLELELIERFGIKRALIALDHQDEHLQRKIVASLVGSYLSRTLRAGKVIAVGMGRNVSAIADSVSLGIRHECTFVSAIGGSVRAGEYMNSDHIGRRLAAQFGGESETLYAPALVADSEQRTALMLNDTVRQTLDKARRADIALIGVGDLSENSNMVRMGWFSPSEIAAARISGTVGDMMGYDFIDLQGHPAMTNMQGRIIGLNIDDLTRIPDVIAIASEPSKAAGILAALRTKAIDTLATSVSNIHTILQLDDATRK